MTTPTAAPCHEAALSYARLGWAVLPLHSIRDGRCTCGKAEGECKPGKHPRTRHGLNDASTDPAQINRWWGAWPDANVGIATGPGSGILALDVDPEHGGGEALAALERQHGALPPTPRQRTGGGGEHIIFRYPPDRRIQSRAGKLGPGLDVRGAGGYIVAAPSLHLSGGVYDWGLSGDPETVAVADAPPWLLALLDGHGGPAPDPYEVEERRAIEGEAESGDAIPEGKRHDTLIRLAGKLRRAGLDESALMAALREHNRAHCRPPLPAPELAKIARDIGGKPTPAGGEARAKPECRPKLTRLSTVAPERVKWLWRSRLPLGKLSMYAGDPCLGKSLLALDHAARVTTAKPWPDGADPAPLGNVIILSAEDDMADTIRPRLDAAGAAPERVLVLEAVRESDPEREQVRERSFNLGADVAVLEDAIKQTGDVRLVVVDPISAYLGGADSHNNADVRGLLAPLCALAERHGVAVLLVSHLNKNAGGPVVYRTSGSLAFLAAARAGWGVARDKDDPARRLFLPLKMNLAPDPTGLAFRIEQDPEAGQPVVAWEPDPVLVSAEDAFAPKAPEDRPPPAVRAAADWLRELLKTAPLPVKEVEAAARAAGLSFATVRKAMPHAGATAYKSGFGAGWVWEARR